VKCVSHSHEQTIRAHFSEVNKSGQQVELSPLMETVG